MFYREAHRIEIVPQVVDALCGNGGYAHSVRKVHEVPMPSVDALRSVMEDIRGVLFPGFFGPADVRAATLRFHVGSTLDSIATRLSEQILRGFCFVCNAGDYQCCSDCEKRACEITSDFLRQLPDIRDLLNSDAQAAFEGDPAARSPGEAIFCYPSMAAMANHRVAHVLHCAGVPLIPRILAEIAHSTTGIDIHPGASIAERFFMDHGTGIVIGETAVIGRNVRLYQGVTLGAKSFPLDSAGQPVKGVPRHPILEDDVIIYAGATLLGRITIGRGAVIGGNLWVTRDVPPGASLQQGRPIQSAFEDGGGI